MGDPALNLGRLEDVLGDDRDSIAEILELAAGTCRGALTNLRGTDASAPLEVARYAHAMKGAAANVGAEELAAVATELEIAARTGALERLNTFVQQIADAYERFEVAVKEYRAGLTASPDPAAGP
jgi:HPt (histidine-containing phosphotransfer) domain-containing protein